MDKTDRSIDIMVLQLGNKDFASLLDEVVLDGPNVLNILDVFVEARVNRHVFRSHCKSLAMFLLAFYVEDKRNAIWILRHHFF